MLQYFSFQEACVRSWTVREADILWSPFWTKNVLKNNLQIFTSSLLLLFPSQVKYSELTLDMFRMLQVLEREPSEEPHLYDTSPAAGRNPIADPHGANSDRLAKRENPHKYLLYKPTFGQIYNFLAHGLKELPQGGR